MQELFLQKVELYENLIRVSEKSDAINQQQTNEAFSEKWEKMAKDEAEVHGMEIFQVGWYLQLYGFGTEENFIAFLADKKVIIDAGCGLGYKAAWMAKLAPEAIVLGIDYSTSVEFAAQRFKSIENLFFVRGDIADTGMRPGTVDYVSCDQVIMHTENPEKTFSHLSSLLSNNGEFACYVYARKALPRELLDEYFRKETHTISSPELWQMSEQLTQLGRNLSNLNVKVIVPEIPVLGIKAGEYDIQRFIYWNFIKCFYNPELNWDVNVSTNFDWYSPSNARRYTAEEFLGWAKANRLTITYQHTEEACHTGRFRK